MISSCLLSSQSFVATGLLPSSSVPLIARFCRQDCLRPLALCPSSSHPSSWSALPSLLPLWHHLPSSCRSVPHLKQFPLLQPLHVGGSSFSPFSRIRPLSALFAPSPHSPGLRAFFFPVRLVYSLLSILCPLLFVNLAPRCLLLSAMSFSLVVGTCSSCWLPDICVPLSPPTLLRYIVAILYPSL